jgi:aromatic ring hydroxylase
LAVSTEHEDITKVEAFREMCEAAIKVYDGTEDQTGGRLGAGGAAAPG